MKMLPIFPHGGIPSSHFRDIIPNCQFSKLQAILSIFTDSKDFLFSQFAHTMALSTVVRLIFSSLGGHIAHIFKKITEKEMIRSNTLRIIARMKNLLAFWDRPKVYLPRNTMGFFSATLSCIHGPIIISAIPAMEASYPEPAAICFIDFLPKAIREGAFLFRERLIAGLTAILSCRVVGGNELALAN